MAEIVPDLSAHPSFEVTGRAEKNNVRGRALNVKSPPFLASLSVYGKNKPISAVYTALDGFKTGQVKN